MYVGIQSLTHLLIYICIEKKKNEEKCQAVKCRKVAVKKEIKTKIFFHEARH